MSEVLSEKDGTKRRINSITSLEHEAVTEMGLKEGVEQEKVWVQVLADTVACLSAVSVGLLFSWTSPFIVKITGDKINYDITDDEALYLTVIPPIAMVLCCPIFSKLCDIIGRKRTLMLITIPHLMSWILTIVSSNIFVLYFSRFWAGAGDGCLFAALPMYVGEVSTPRVRGIWGNLVNVFTYFGVFLINAIGSQFSVEMTAYICIPLPIIFCIAMSYMPESPYWFIMRDREDDAKASLRRLRSKENVDDIYLQLKSDVARQMSEKGTWTDLFMNETNRKALIAGIFLRVSQLLGGVTVFSVYTQYIFEQSGAELSSEIPAMIYTGLCFVLIFIAGFVVEKFGRRKTFMNSILFCGIVLLLEGIYFYLDTEVASVDLSSIKWFPIVGMILYIIFCSFGIILIPTLMLAELFSASVKAKGVSVLVMTFGIMLFVANNLFNLLKVHVGMYAPFLFFGVSNLISTFLTLYFVPETSGKTLEEIQQSLKKQSGVV
nr:facilitated trehalose transporter Tret1-like isoform X2 [Leptinotarsa decemlineata]